MQAQGLLSTLPSLLATQAQTRVHSTALQTKGWQLHQQKELPVCNTNQKQFQSVQKKPKTTKQDPRLHSCWGRAWHNFMLANSNLHLCQDRQQCCSLGTGRQQERVAPVTAAKTLWLLEERLGTHMRSRGTHF